MPKPAQPHEIPAVHVHIEGLTAFFRYTGIISGNQLTLPCPTYANLLGLISACADKTVYPRDTRIGFEFSHVSLGEDLERTERLELKRGRLRPHREGRGLLRRQMHFRPRLDLYLTNLDLANAFTNPAAIPCLGRSQDVCWITSVKYVDLLPVKSGMIGATMIGMRDNILDTSIPSDIIRCTEWFINEQTGFIRKAGPIGFYQVIDPDDGRISITTDNLYHPSNLPQQDVIYLHEWMEGKARKY
jgi:CRISPR-associated Cas5-like protein